MQVLGIISIDEKDFRETVKKRFGYLNLIWLKNQYVGSNKIIVPIYDENYQKCEYDLVMPSEKLFEYYELYRRVKNGSH